MKTPEQIQKTIHDLEYAFNAGIRHSHKSIEKARSCEGHFIGSFLLLFGILSDRLTIFSFLTTFTIAYIAMKVFALYKAYEKIYVLYIILRHHMNIEKETDPQDDAIGKLYKYRYVVFATLAALTFFNDLSIQNSRVEYSKEILAAEIAELLEEDESISKMEPSEQAEHIIEQFKHWTLLARNDDDLGDAPEGRY